MVMKNEKGITLVELLAAVVIAGIIIVPLLTIMTGTFTRTASQEKETQIAYVAQEDNGENTANNPSYLPKPTNKEVQEYTVTLIIFKNTPMKVVMGYWLVSIFLDDPSRSFIL